MKLDTLRTEAFTVARKLAGDGLTYHGKVGFFKLYTPVKHKWGNDVELRLVTLLHDAADKATNALRKLGFQRQSHNVAVFDEQQLGKNRHCAKSYNAGLASDKGHGILIGRNAVLTGDAVRVLVHEWAHKFWYQLTSEEQAEVTSVYDKLVVAPLADQDAWKKIERKMVQEWTRDLELNMMTHLGLSYQWLEDPKKQNAPDDVTAYLEGLKQGSVIEGTIKKPLEHVLFKDTRKEGTLDVGDLVWVELTGRMWMVRESRDRGEVSSRYLSPKMVIEHIAFRPEAKAFKAVQSL